MNANEFFHRVSEASLEATYFKCLLVELSNERKHSGGAKLETLPLIISEIDKMEQTYCERLFDEYSNSIKLIQSAESVLLQLPSARWAQAIRRKYIYGWKVSKIATELSVSNRSIYNMLDEAFDWLDKRNMLADDSHAINAS